MRYLFLLLLLPLGMGQCKQTPEFKLGETFELAPGLTYRSAGGDLTVRFEAVTEDSRCPEGVSCVWQGQAVVKLHLAGQGAQALDLTLQDGKPALARASALGHLFTLERVSPYPKAETPIQAGDYRIRLKVERP